MAGSNVAEKTKHGNGSTSNPKQVKTSPKEHKDAKEKEVCKFFKNGRCNKEEGRCRFSHPRICRKFNQFGGKEDNDRGCVGKCGFFHPNALWNLAPAELKTCKSLFTVKKQIKAFAKLLPV